MPQPEYTRRLIVAHRMRGGGYQNAYVILRNGESVGDLVETTAARNAPVSQQLLHDGQSYPDMESFMAAVEATIARKARR